MPARAVLRLGGEGSIMSDDQEARRAAEELAQWAADPPPPVKAHIIHQVRQLLYELHRASSAVPVGVEITPGRERRRHIFVLTHLSKFVREVGATAEESGYIYDLALALE